MLPTIRSQQGQKRMRSSMAGMAGLCGWASFAAAFKLWEGHAGYYVPMYLTIGGLAFLFALCGVVAFWKVARLETTPKLFALTFLLVAYDGSDLASALRSLHPSPATIAGSLSMHGNTALPRLTRVSSCMAAPAPGVMARGACVPCLPVEWPHAELL